MDDMDDNMDTFCSSIKCLWKRGRWQEINSEARKGRCGDWTLVGFEYSDSVDDIEPSVDNPYYDAENEWIVSDILIYDEENTLYADYSRIGYENESINGMALVKQDPTSDGQPVARKWSRKKNISMWMR